MKNEILKLKKYLLLISIVFFLLPLSHLIYVYLYHDAELIAIKWWSISEWLFGNFPNLNPLKPLNWNNKYIVNLLYRSILRYDISEDKIVSDIASCDISNLLYIECYLENNILWSNGKEISVEDIIATYKILQNTNTNPIIQSLLLETEITWENNIITFKNKKSDINFLNVLFQPILPKEVIDEIWEDNLKWNFSTIDGIYSWRYKIINVSRDLTLWVTKFILEKNENYLNNPVIIDKLILKLFATPNDLLRNKDSINIFNDKNNLIWESIPRFDVQQYSLPQYVWIFLNKDKVQDVSLRNFILNQINQENLLKILWEDNFKIVDTPYLTGTVSSSKASNKNLENVISKLWYYKKSKFLKDLEKTKEPYSNEANIKDQEESETLTWKTIADFQKDSEYIILPEYVDRYNFITKNNVILKWVTPENTSEVHINEQKIETFTANNRYFYFPIAQNTQEWENTYKINYTIDWEKKLYEEVTFVYHKDKKVLEWAEIILVNKLIEEEKKKEELRKQLETIELESNEELDKKTKSINELDENLYYNKDLEKFSLDLVYILWENEIEKTAVYIKTSLESVGINVKLRPIALNQLKQVIGKEKDYYMILAGINLWYFPFNLFPYLHSSQVKNWYNFSNIRKTSLDILLEELKGDTLQKTRIEPIQKKVLQILEKEQILKTLYTPKISILIDKNIKNTSLKEYIPNKSLRSEILSNMYILDKKIINFENKSPINFLTFIIKKLND